MPLYLLHISKERPIEYYTFFTKNKLVQVLPVFRINIQARANVLINE